MFCCLGQLSSDSHMGAKPQGQLEHASTRAGHVLTHANTHTDTNMHTRTADVPHHGCNSVIKLCKQLNEYVIEHEHRKRMSRIFCHFQLQMLNIKDFVPHMSVDTLIWVLVRALIMQIFLIFSIPATHYWRWLSVTVWLWGDNTHSTFSYSRTVILCFCSPMLSLTIVHGQHLLGLARLDTILRMTAEWERAQIMTEPKRVQK